MRRAKDWPPAVRPVSAGQPAPEAITALASSPDGTSDFGAMSVYEAMDEVAESAANAPVAPAREAAIPTTMHSVADRRKIIDEG